MARIADPNARSSLIAAARREFVKNGLMRARVEDITAACGLSKGAFYLHFESKESLFRSLVTELMEHVAKHANSRDAAYRKEAKGKKIDVITWGNAVAAVDRREDLALLELLWEWRDVCSVLLRGSSGTEFEGVLWELIDAQVARVSRECGVLQKENLVRADLPGDLLGHMVVGTYMMMARRLVDLPEKPDFTPWVGALQAVLTEGLSPQRLKPPKKNKKTVSPRKNR
ncbi:MAG: TetR/AcrR family transcriptional regulator [Archangium sp.]